MERPSEEDLRRLYWEEDLSLRAIGRHYGVAKNSVERWMLQMHLMRRPPRSSQQSRIDISDEALYRMHHRDKKSISEIAKEIGCHPSNVERRFLKANIPHRSRSEAARTEAQRRWSDPHNSFRSRGNVASLAQWRASHPEELREHCSRAGRQNWKGHRQRFVVCGWCAGKISLCPAHIKRQADHCCSRSHRSKLSAFRRYHPDEPRPLILARLRELAGEERNPDRLRRVAAEIGASDIEVAEILFPVEESP